MLKVLIGDDDQDDIELFGEALFGVSPCAKLIIATTGAEVLDRLKTAHHVSSFWISTCRQ